MSQTAKTQDEEHLRLLSIFHYVVGGISLLFSLLFPGIYLILGILFLVFPEDMDSSGEPVPAFMGWMFIIFGIVGMVIGFAFAAFILLTGRFLGKRRHRIFCIVMAGIECLFQPFGTVLGIFTIIVLMKDSVKHLFEVDSAAHRQLDKAEEEM